MRHNNKDFVHSACTYLVVSTRPDNGFVSLLREGGSLRVVDETLCLVGEKATRIRQWKHHTNRTWETIECRSNRMIKDVTVMSLADDRIIL